VLIEDKEKNKKKKRFFRTIYKLSLNIFVAFFLIHVCSLHRREIEFINSRLTRNLKNFKFSSSFLSLSKTNFLRFFFFIHELSTFFQQTECRREKRNVRDKKNMRNRSPLNLISIHSNIFFFFHSTSTTSILFFNSKQHRI
jgi:hypothetical protein